MKFGNIFANKLEGWDFDSEGFDKVVDEYWEPVPNSFHWLCNKHGITFIPIQPPDREVGYATIEPCWFCHDNFYLVVEEEEMEKVLLGTGVLNWNRGERVSDRYGTVHLSTDPGESATVSFDETLDGTTGDLSVEILETRQSRHIGDMFRGVSPVTPDKGEEFSLGEGTLFFEDSYDDENGVGLKPEDGRTNDWMDINKLYRAHFQTVNLFFTPKK